MAANSESILTERRVKAANALRDKAKSLGISRSDAVLLAYEEWVAK